MRYSFTPEGVILQGAAKSLAFHREMEENATGTALALMFLIILASAVSFALFINQSLRLDEAQSLWQSARTPIGIVRLVAEDVHVPLYHILLHYWEVLFGNGVAVARMLSLAFFL